VQEPEHPPTRGPEARPDRFAASARRGRGLPSRLLRSSAALGWRHVFAEVYADPPEVPAFTTTPTPDLLLVHGLSGLSTIESRRGAAWRGAQFRAGSVAATAPGRTSTLRWRAATPAPVTSLHLHLHHDLLVETAAALGTAGAADALPDALSLTDPFLAGVGPALLGALVRGDTSLYADTLATAAAAHALADLHPPARPRPAPGGLTGRQLAAVADHMHAHLAEDVRLDDLAAALHLSKFHFVRAFRASTGTTPHRRLTALRLARAAELLRTTDLPVREVARLSGWTSPSRFSAAFRGRHGVPPTAYRAAG
jgi:AraC family transcriptional regulator